jgi:hypothetical protein
MKNDPSARYGAPTPDLDPDLDPEIDRRLRLFFRDEAQPCMPPEMKARVLGRIDSPNRRRRAVAGRWGGFGRGLLELAAVLAIVAIAGTALMVRTATQPNAPVSSASAAVSASPSVRPTASSAPSAAPSVADLVDATALASIPHCQYENGWQYAISGNDLFVVCASPPDNYYPTDGTGHPHVTRIDLTTDQVTATYQDTAFVMAVIQGPVVVGDSLWFSGGPDNCFAPCKGSSRLERFDLATGKNTFDQPDMSLVGSGFGYVWAGRLDKNELWKLDPTTGRKLGSVPFPDGAGHFEFACGSLWYETSSGSVVTDVTDDVTTTVTRVDLASGKIQSRFTVSGGVSQMASVGNDCWAAILSNGPGTPVQFVQIGASGIESVSSKFDLGNGNTWESTWESFVDAQGGAFWLVRIEPNGPLARLQRIDPSTGRPSGTIWQINGYGYPAVPFAIINGSVWSFNDNDGISRLDIQLGP